MHNRKMTNRNSIFKKIIATTFLTGILAICLHSFSAIGETMELIKNGESDYTIVLPQNAIPAEKTAAHELQSYLYKISGANLPIIVSGTVGKKQIVIGQSPQIAKLLDVDFNKLKVDEIIIKTVDGNLFISGDRPRGALYAAYVFLEDVLGVRWWTSWEESVPKKESIDLYKLNISYAPSIQVRHVMYLDVHDKSRSYFAARSKMNCFSRRQISTEYGGSVDIIDFVHTFFRIIPPKKYFKKHPEWYSLSGDGRIGDIVDAQLCLSNDEMRKEFTKVVLGKLRKSISNPKVISISQQDNTKYCRCEKCAAVDRAEGSPSGSLIHFVNKVAEDVEKEFPDALVTTLAYQYTQKPPEKVKPRHNVVIRMCAIDANYTAPLNSEINKEFRDDVIAWGKISNHTAFWNYAVNFENYLIPHPTSPNFGKDIEFFMQNKPFYVLEQADSHSGSRVGYFANLKSWVLCKLLWNPNLKQETLIDEFLEGYYGAAAPYLKLFMQLMKSELNKSEKVLTLQENDASWISREGLNKASELLLKASNAVNNNKKLKQRVDCVRISIDTVWIMRRFTKEYKDLYPIYYNGEKNQSGFVEAYINSLDKMGFLKIGEGGKGAATYYEGLRQAAKTNGAEPPMELKSKLKQNNWHDCQPDDFNTRLLREGRGVSLKDDKLASNGRAIYLPTKTPCWHIQIKFPEISKFDNNEYTIFVVARIEGENKGVAFSMGVYDFVNKKDGISKDILAEDVGNEKYVLHELGSAVINSGKYIWISPVSGNVSVKSVWVDRVFLLKKESSAESVGNK